MTRTLNYESNVCISFDWRPCIRWLSGYATACSFVCLFSIVGIRYAQRRFSSEAIFKDAIGTSFYDDLFVVFPMWTIFSGASLMTVVGVGWMVGAKKRANGIGLMTLAWLLMIVVEFGMTTIIWEDASP